MSDPGGTGLTPTQFAQAVLSGLGVSDTPANEQALVAWAYAEGGAGPQWNPTTNNITDFNPFNTTLKMPGSRDTPGNGNTPVQAYQSWQQGIQATIDTLKGYRGILTALQAGNNAQAVVNAIVNSPWGTKAIDLAGATTYGNTPDTGSVSQQAGSTQQPAGPYNPNQNYGPLTSSEQQWLLQNAGQDAWMLGIPELANIVGYVTRNQITDQNEVTSLLQQTQFFKTHADATQSWIQTYGADPAQASRLIHQAQISIQDQAGQMGATLTQDQLNTLAIDQNYFGLTQDEMQLAIAQYLPTTQPSTQGQAGVDFNSLKSAATLTWGVPETDQQIQQWVTQIESGQQTLQGVEAQLKTKAATLYPQLSQQFSQGLTFDQAVSPYKGIIQQYLNIDPSQVNFMDPKWAQLLSQGPTTGNGSSAAGVSGPSLDQFAQQIRSNPVYGYQNTMNAANEMTGLTNATAKTLGIIGQ